MRDAPIDLSSFEERAPHAAIVAAELLVLLSTLAAPLSVRARFCAGNEESSLLAVAAVAGVGEAFDVVEASVPVHVAASPF